MSTRFQAANFKKFKGGPQRKRLLLRHVNVVVMENEVLLPSSSPFATHETENPPQASSHDGFVVRSVPVTSSIPVMNMTTNAPVTINTSVMRSISVTTRVPVSNAPATATAAPVLTTVPVTAAVMTIQFQ